MKPETNENIQKLRELTDKICKDGKDKPEIILHKVKKVLHDGLLELADSKNINSKFKCYERMFSTIDNILEKAKS